MSELIRPVLWVSQDQRLQLFAADSACSGCASPCRSMTPAPASAVPAELSLPSSVLNRLVLAFFGIPLVLLGALIWSLETATENPLMPVIVFVGVLGGCAAGGAIAKRMLPEVERALKASCVIPTIERKSDGESNG